MRSLGWLAVMAATALAVPVVAAEPVLERALTPGGPWAEDTNATIEETAPNEWRITTPLGGEATSAFYQVVAAEGFSAIELKRVQTTDRPEVYWPRWRVKVVAAGNDSRTTSSFTAAGWTYRDPS